MNLPEAAVVIYGALVALGGLMGYLKARSIPSLVLGLLFGVALILSALFAGAEGAVPADLPLWLVLGLTVLSLYRLNLTRRFMPAGLLVLLGAIVAAILLTAR
jgi:uncharacterized membrane protein (UPF0136 family)